VEPQVLERKEVHSIDSTKDRTDFWHTDITFMNRPAMASLLRSVIVPAAGGDTMWADTGAAYEGLAKPLRRLCDELSAFHFEPFYAQAVAEGHGNVWEGKKLTRLSPAPHPIRSCPSGDGEKESLREPEVHDSCQGRARNAERRAPPPSLRTHDQSVVRRAVPLEARNTGLLGQPVDDALRDL
jgi:alpha-ketoglutarate-dependent taurine dioxygenase